MCLTGLNRTKGIQRLSSRMATPPTRIVALTSPRREMFLSPLAGQNQRGGSRSLRVCRVISKLSCPVNHTPHPNLPPQGGKGHVGLPCSLRLQYLLARKNILHIQWHAKTLVVRQGLVVEGHSAWAAFTLTLSLR